MTEKQVNAIRNVLVKVTGALLEMERELWDVTSDVKEPKKTKVAEKKTKTPKKETKKPKKEAKKEADPMGVDHDLTQDDVRAALKDYVKKHDKEAAVDLLKKYGSRSGRLKDLPEHNYPDLVEDTLKDSSVDDDDDF